MATKKKHKKKATTTKLVTGRRGRTHIERCNRGFAKANYFYREVHHVVCVHSCSDATISEQLEGNDENIQRVRDCLELTNWDINDAHNTVGLPKKRAFYKHPASMWGGWPCHQVDHNCADGYTETVSRYLTDNVWNEALKKAKNCEFEAKSLEKLLKDSSDYWFDFLEARGGENAGTAFCWKNRFKISDGKCSDPRVTEPWYHPFSMHPGTPTQRNPPPDEDSFSNKFKELLSATFGS